MSNAQLRAALATVVRHPDQRAQRVTELIVERDRLADTYGQVECGPRMGARHVIDDVVRATLAAIDLLPNGDMR